MKGTGMLVVSFRGVNWGIWYRLGCYGQNAIIFSHQGLVKFGREEIRKKKEV